jgi:hypothetical protein
VPQNKGWNERLVSLIRAGVWHDKFFSRAELDEVADYVREHNDRNVYFCPHGFSSNRPPADRRSARVKENAVLPSLLWADMDACDPRKCKWRPTIAIESSPERYVGLWECDGVVTEHPNREQYLASAAARTASARARKAKTFRGKARRRNAIPEGADVVVINRAYAALRRKAKRLDMTVDHKTPLAECRVCGARGLHETSNFQLLTLEDNSSKGNRCVSCWVRPVVHSVAKG